MVELRVLLLEVNLGLLLHGELLLLLLLLLSEIRPGLLENVSLRELILLRKLRQLLLIGHLVV